MALGVTLFSGLLMVSRFRYYSFKTLPFKETVPFVWILLLVLIFVLLTLAPAKVLLIVFSIYAVSGVLMTTLGIRRKRNLKKSTTKDSNKKDLDDLDNKAEVKDK